MIRAPRHDRFLALLDEHRLILFRVVQTYTRSVDDREDLAQEITLQLWRSFGRYDQRERFSTWMYRIALNVAISFVRRETVRNRHLSPDLGHLIETIEDPAQRSDELRWIYDFIGRQEPLNRALLLLYLDGHAYDEIAKVLGISETNVATKIGRLKQTMRREAAPSETN